MARLITRAKKGKHDKKTHEYYAPDESQDYHTEYGPIPKAALKKGGVHALGGERFTILPATFMDRYARLKRGAQVIQPKDLGLIIAETGIGTDSSVLDIGAGSGFAAALLARVAKNVSSYDVDEKALTITRENLASLGITNVTVAKGDAYDEATIAERDDADLFLLDVPEPWRALGTAKKALRQGGFLVGYTPCITQAMQLVAALDHAFLHVRTVEVLEREWRIDGQAVRPESKDFQHTAFLTFIRKI